MARKQEQRLRVGGIVHHKVEGALLRTTAAPQRTQETPRREEVEVPRKEEGEVPRLGVHLRERLVPPKIEEEALDPKAVAVLPREEATAKVKCTRKPLAPRRKFRSIVRRRNRAYSYDSRSSGFYHFSATH